MWYYMLVHEDSEVYNDDTPSNVVAAFVFSSRSPSKPT